jgi:hypothetical protein
MFNEWQGPLRPGEKPPVENPANVQESEKPEEKREVVENVEQELSPEVVEMIMEKVKFFENIKTPQELLEFMRNNLKFGFVGKNNKKIYSWRDKMNNDWDFSSEYFLQSSDDLIKSGLGTCWDDTEFERYSFESMGYETKVFFMIFAGEKSFPTHTFLAYKEKDKWFWFEYAFGDCRGIHEYNNLEELILDAKGKNFDAALKYDGATSEDEKDLMIFEYEKPRYGCSAQEFVDNAVGGKKIS